jgi:hypothetical protein
VPRTTGWIASGWLAGLGLALALCGCGRFGFAARADDAAPAPDRTATIVGCNVPPAGAVACFSFEDSGVDTTHGDDATTTAVTYEVGRVGDAVRLGPNSLIAVADAPALHLTATGTVAAWLLLDSLPPAGERSVVLDTNAYGMAVRSTGEVECFYTGTYHVFGAGVVAGTWTHLACTYDGAAVTMWKDGVAIATEPDSGPVKNTVSALQVGSNIVDPNHPGSDLLLGLLDEVGVWNVSLTMADLCAATGGC